MQEKFFNLAIAKSSFKKISGSDTKNFTNTHLYCGYARVFSTVFKSNGMI